MAGRPKKYKTAEELKAAIDGYLESIRYYIPVVVSVPTGEVDKDGHIKYKTLMLTENFDGTGKPKKVAKYLEPPNVPALRLYLGVSKSTFAEYRKDPALKSAVAYWDDVYEGYLAMQLETGKHVSGVIFNLEHNFGWRHKVETSMDKESRRAIAASGMTMEEKRRLLREAAKEFAGAEEEKGPQGRA